MLEIDLQKLGLNEKEVKIYLASLELGYATAQDIAKKSGINRATTYFIIDGLIKKGLITQIEKNKKTYFAAEDPKGLSVIIENKIKEAEETKNVFNDILPHLESIYNLAAEKPIIRYYEGIEGLKAMRVEFLKTTGKEVVGFTAIDPLMKYFPKHEEEHTLKRVQKGIKSRVIYTSGKGPVPAATNLKLLREARYVPPEKFNFTSDISVYENRVSLTFLREKLGGVIIESKELADTMRAIFELSWEGAEKYQ